jgi:hypothetical protein
MIQTRSILAAVAVALLFPFAASAHFVVTSQSGTVMAEGDLDSSIELTPLDLRIESVGSLATLSTSFAPDLLMVDAMAVAGSGNPAFPGSASALLQLRFTVTEGTDVAIQVGPIGKQPATVIQALIRLDDDGSTPSFSWSGQTSQTHMNAGTWQLTTFLAIDGSNDIVRQQVSIAAVVPEPSALTTMGLGLSAMAWAVRRRAVRPARPV